MQSLVILWCMAFVCIVLALTFFTDANPDANLHPNQKEEQNQKQNPPTPQDIHYVAITIPSRKNKLFQRLSSQLAKFQLPLQLHWGVNKNTIDLSKVNLSPKYRDFFERNEKEFRAGKTKNNYIGHCAATLSHLEVLKNVQGPTIIFEDDAEIVPQFPERLHQVLNAVYHHDPDFDILLLGFCCRYSDHADCRLNDQYHVFQEGFAQVQFFIGAWGYFVKNQTVAAKILSYFDPIDWHIDLHMAAQIKQNKLKCYACIPTLVNHPGRLRISSFDFEQQGDVLMYQSDTNR